MVVILEERWRQNGEAQLVSSYYTVD